MNEFVGMLMAFFQWVVAASIASTLVAGVTIAGKRALGNRLSPKWHYLLWFVVLAKLVLPSWTWNLPQRMDEVIPDRALPAVGSAFELVPSKAVGTLSSYNITLHIVFWVWLSVALFLLIRVFARNIRFAWRLRKLSPIDDPAVLLTFEECKKLMSVRRNIRLVETDIVSGPALFGFIRPSIIVPNLRELARNERQLRYVFMHELAHVRRKDIAVNGMMQLMLALHWFNPILWYACSRMREDQEVACDAFVLSRLRPEETKEYGQTLIALIEKASLVPKIAGLASWSGNRAQIKRRVLMIRAFKRPSPIGSLFGAVVLLMLGLFVFTFGMAKTEASLRQYTVEDTIESKRIMTLLGYDAQGQPSTPKAQVAKVNGEWKMQFLTSAEEPDLNDSNGVFVFPETGYHSGPGIRNLIFVKQPSDKEWGLASIEEYDNTDAVVEQYIP